VVQAYLAAPPGDRASPVRTLAAFAIAIVPPGQAAEVRLRVPARAFMRYDEAEAGWVPVRGERTIQVGRSSRDLRLSGLVVCS
jgi:beta-glucosidase